MAQKNGSNNPGNISFEVTKDNHLVIKVDLKKKLGKSKSGKSELIASTYGNVMVDGTSGAKLGFNLYRPVAA